ncbi:MAG: glycosyltransferase [Flavobacteriales bacterium]
MTNTAPLAKPKIVHLSSAHYDRDVRIFLKECKSLAALFPDHEVHLILPGVDARTEDGVHIHSSGPRGKSKFQRMYLTVNQVFKKALELDGVCYHLHDPELLRLSLKFKKKGKKVIYDAHEDLPRQFIGNSGLPAKQLLSKLIERIENYFAKRVSGVITATPFIAERFKKINANTLDINNYPLATEIELIEGATQEKENFVCYIGGIWPSRGLQTLVDAFETGETKLALAGKIEPEFKVSLQQSKGWKNVQELGFIDRQHAVALKQKALAGIVTFLPLPNHVNAQPNKIFEYMSAGLPVIGSHFPLWRALIEDKHCGICVDPTNSAEIASAIQYLVANPEDAKRMGANGKKMVQSTFNWSAEEKKLQAFYQKVLAS